MQRINKLKRQFQTNLIGLSDHTNDISSSLISLTYGVVAIEKHYKIDNKFKTADSTFSITPNEFLKLKKNSLSIFKSFTKKDKKAERISFKLRRSIFAKKNILKNSKLSNENIETLRPFIGICASNYFKILGKKINKNLKAGEPILEKYLN